MRNAPLVSLADIAQLVQYGYTASASDTEIGPKLLRITDIVSPQIDWDSVPYCEIDERNLSKFSLAKNDIVIARTGATVGYAKLIRDHERSVFASYLVRVRVDPEKADPGYVGRIVESDVYKRFVLSRVGGAAQPNANAKVLASFRLPIPDRRVQTRIADILSAYDYLIENNRRRIALLEEATRLLYRKWFVHFRFPGHERVNITDGLPEGWESQYLRDVVTTQYGHTASASDIEVGPKFVRGTDINKRSFIDWSTVPYCPEEGLDFNKYALVPSDILVIRMADPGKVAIVEKSIQSVFASYLVRLKVRNPDKVPPIFLFMTLMDKRYQDFIGASSGGSTRKSASAKLLTDFYFALPPKALLTRFIEQIVPMREMMARLVEQCASAARARDLLLPRLMSGAIII